LQSGHSSGKPGKPGKVRELKSGQGKSEKSGKMNYYNYSVAAIIVQTVICDYNNSTIHQSADFLTLLFQPKYPTYTIIAC